MFSTIKAKLITLTAVATLAILIASGSGIIGMRDGTDAVRQLGFNFLPSVIGL